MTSNRKPQRILVFLLIVSSILLSGCFTEEPVVTQLVAFNYDREVFVGKRANFEVYLNYALDDITVTRTEVYFKFEKFGFAESDCTYTQDESGFFDERIKMSSTTTLATCTVELAHGIFRFGGGVYAHFPPGTYSGFVGFEPKSPAEDPGGFGGLGLITKGYEVPEPYTITVKKYPTTTTIVSTGWQSEGFAVGNDGSVGDTVRVEVNVSSQRGVGSGRVTVRNGTDSCQIYIDYKDSSSKDYCDLVMSELGNATITATYEGDYWNEPSNSSTQAFVFLPEPTMTVSTNPNPSKVGEEIGISVELSVLSGVILPSGKLSVSVVGVGEICEMTLVEQAANSQSVGNCNTTFNQIGTYMIMADYVGDGNYAPISGSVEHLVEEEYKTSTVNFNQASPSPGMPGDWVTFGMTVSGSGAEIPTGIVIVTVNAGSGICTATLDAAGVGGCLIQMNAAGNYMLTATYQGDANYDRSVDTLVFLVSAPTEMPQDNSCNDPNDLDCDGVDNFSDECPGSANPGSVGSDGCP